MSQTYIAAYDGSSASRAAVRFAVALARPEHAEVAVVTAYPEVSPVHVRGAAFDRELQDSLRGSGRAILEGLDVDGASRSILVCGPPAHALHDAAEDMDASLLVVGMTHEGRLGRLLSGSVAAKLLRGAPCPVVAVPAEHAAGPIRTIAVAYEGGTEAREALAQAERLAVQLGARLLLIAVHEPTTYAGPAMIAAGDLDDVLLEQLSHEVEKRAAEIPGLDVETRVLSGSAGRVIVDAAADADLLVTGSRGYGPARSTLMGSTSRHLVDHARCPVLVVPRSAAQAGTQAGKGAVEVPA